ncbi:glycosyltransferase family 2 protein [Haloarcula hispanica]|uniref:Glycosyltransferase family 2 protein n=1 Tax=Haloarcula hispanica TaxID=51589 RepID=A0A5J5LLG5_HALHI|nr:glycosyltransferase family 2 protein [Haloarcula hispanica]KAA9410376.1 glycosyltransferase family 2 protein [Haloarcula hispanica]
MSFFDVLLATLLLGSIVALLQTFVLYPAELFLINAISPSQQTRNQSIPSVTLVIAAYNEEEVIGEKIENSLRLDYPDSKLDIVVFSDGSTDRTDEIVRSYATDGIELQRIEGRVGKTVCQNKVVESIETDLVVFSDANSMYDPDAIEHLVEGFSEGVGCVVGELRYDGGTVDGESIYWRYERQIKQLESDFFSLVGGNGAIYAVRRESYVSLPEDAISDFAEPLAIVRGGERVTYEPDAVARENTEEEIEEELSRRVRIISRSWNSLVDNLDLLNPMSRPKFAFQLFSHKVLRWLSPLFLIVALVSSGLLIYFTDWLIYRVIFSSQILFYSLAAAGWLFEVFNLDAPTIIHVPHYFVISNLGMAQGLIEFLRNGPVITWETTDRTE